MIQSEPAIATGGGQTASSPLDWGNILVKPHKLLS
jgi:hypothetical protein